MIRLRDYKEDGVYFYPSLNVGKNIITHKDVFLPSDQYRFDTIEDCYNWVMEYIKDNYYIANITASFMIFMGVDEEYKNNRTGDKDNILYYCTNAIIVYDESFNYIGATLFYRPITYVQRIGAIYKDRLNKGNKNRSLEENFKDKELVEFMNKYDYVYY